MTQVNYKESLFSRLLVPACLDRDRGSGLMHHLLSSAEPIPPSGEKPLAQAKKNKTKTETETETKSYKEKVSTSICSVLRLTICP